MTKPNRVSILSFFKARELHIFRGLHGVKLND
jgi:hypothetical protein